jgi:chemotaxis protein MotB
MQEAFGVQAEIEVKTIPKGTSLIAQEFSPGRPEQTILNEVRQFTVNSNMNSLDIGQKRAIEIAEQERRAETQAEALREALAREIADGKLLIRRESTNVIVQILERDSFPSGSAALESGFLPTLAKIGALLGPMTGAVTVSGHTDNVPISTSQYRSNWDLSAARAVTVAHELLDAGMEPERIMISGHADTQPRASNDTAAGRALNRRIDITLVTNRSRHGTWVEDGDAPPANDGPAANDSAAATEPTATSPPTPTAEPAAAAEPQATAQPAGGGPGV